MPGLIVGQSGEIWLPDEVCSRHGFTSGTLLRVVETRSGVILARETSDVPTEELTREMEEWQTLSLDTWKLFSYEELDRTRCPLDCTTGGIAFSEHLDNLQCQQTPPHVPARYAGWFDRKRTDYGISSIVTGPLASKSILRRFLERSAVPNKGRRPMARTAASNSAPSQTIAAA